MGFLFIQCSVTRKNKKISSSSESPDSKSSESAKTMSESEPSSNEET